MRMVKMQQRELTLDEVVKRFLMVKEAQHTSEGTMQNYRNRLRQFVESSHHRVEYEQLEADVLSFFSAIPDTSPARYNNPFQNVNALLNWMVEQGYIPQNPIKVLKLHKRKDEGNVKPIPIDDLKAFLHALDRTTYIGLRDTVILLVMLDTGIRTKELLCLREGDYSRSSHSLAIEKTVAKTRQKRIVYLSNQTADMLEDFLSRKPDQWEDWLFPNYEGRQLKVKWYVISNK